MYKAKWRDSDSAIRLVSKFNNGEYSGTVLRLLDVITTALFHIINASGGKILAIKLVRSLAVAMEHPSLGGLKEAKDFVETECITFEEPDESAREVHLIKDIDTWRESSFSYMDQCQDKEAQIHDLQGEIENWKYKYEQRDRMFNEALENNRKVREKLSGLEQYLNIDKD